MLVLEAISIEGYDLAQQAAKTIISMFWMLDNEVLSKLSDQNQGLSAKVQLFALCLSILHCRAQLWVLGLTMPMRRKLF